MTGFSARTEPDGAAVCLHLCGDLDETAAAEARASFAAALAAGPATLALDLSELSFMDSTGIWLLVDTHRRCLAAGVELRLTGTPPASVARALSVSGVDELIDGPAGDPDRDGGGVAREPVRLRLYVSSPSAPGSLAADAARRLVEQLPPGAVELEVLDVFEAPDRAHEDRVIATPTLIRLTPAPRVRIVGSIEDPDAVRRHLGLAG